MRILEALKKTCNSEKRNRHEVTYTFDDTAVVVGRYSNGYFPNHHFLEPLGKTVSCDDLLHENAEIVLSRSFYTIWNLKEREISGIIDEDGVWMFSPEDMNYVLKTLNPKGQLDILDIEDFSYMAFREIWKSPNKIISLYEVLKMCVGIEKRRNGINILYTDGVVSLPSAKARQKRIGISVLKRYFKATKWWEE